MAPFGTVSRSTASGSSPSISIAGPQPGVGILRTDEACAGLHGRTRGLVTHNTPNRPLLKQNLHIPLACAQSTLHPPPPVPHVGPDANSVRTLLIKPGQTFGKPLDGLCYHPQTGWRKSELLICGRPKTATGIRDCLPHEPGAYRAYHHRHDVAHIDGEAIHFPGLFKHLAGVEERQFDVPAV